MTMEGKRLDMRLREPELAEAQLAYHHVFSAVPLIVAGSPWEVLCKMGATGPNFYFLKSLNSHVNSCCLLQ